MTILASNENFLAESENNHLWLSRYSDGYTVQFDRGAISEFKECLAKHGPDKTLGTYSRIPKPDQWKPCYKPEKMPK